MVPLLRLTAQSTHRLLFVVAPEAGVGDPVALHVGVVQLPRCLYALGGLVNQPKVSHSLTCHCHTISHTTVTVSSYCRSYASKIGTKSWLKIRFLHTFNAVR